MRTPTPSLSREKLLFLFTALASAVLLYFFIVSRPVELAPGKVLTSQRPRPARLNSMPRDLLAEGAYFKGERSSPFVVPAGVILDRPSHTGDGPAGSGPKSGAAVEEPASQGTPSPETRYSFAGVIVHEGAAHALLLSRASGETFRAREGAVLQGDFTVSRVLKQSIELRDASGHVFVLRDRPVSQ